MKILTAIAFLTITLMFTLCASAKDLPKIHKALDITSDATDFSKAARDTHYLLGGPSHNADYNGTFQNELGEPDWNGFVSVDYTSLGGGIWQVSDYMPLVGLNSAWCGKIFGSDYGYGNNWDEILEFVFVVGNPAESTTVDLTAIVSYNTEIGYDYSFLAYYKNDRVSGNLWEVDGFANDEAIDVSITYQAGEYLNGNEIRLAWRLTSDGAWSTEDGLWPGDGGLWVDDCSVTVTNDGVVNTVFDDFETGSFGNWVVAYHSGVGDFAKIWSNLNDLDPCLANNSPQVAFIDDGLVVPGTGGSFCQTWCYGPGGYIVNSRGGLWGLDGYTGMALMKNSIESPVMAWPDQSYNGSQYYFDVYRHERLTDCQANFYRWSVRSVTGTDPSAIESAIWKHRDYVYYGGPEYIRHGDTEISDLLEPGRTFVQVRAQLEQYVFCWSWPMSDFNDTPAPYFDNFRLLAFPTEGPGFSYRQLDLAQDNFPAHGTIDLEDLGSNSVRFDMAASISPDADLFVNPGDSIVISIAPVREGATIDNLPIIHYTIDANPLFDSYRTSPVTGAVNGQLVINAAGKYAFDLPDEGLLFPGDVLHYYISVEDAINGAEIQSITIPRDITEFGDFTDPMKYHSEFTVHALPTITQDGEDFGVPEILFWNDFGDRGGEDEWYFSFANLGLERGVDYDIYFTQDPSSAVRNGLGGRATLDQIRDYGTMLYSCGDLEYATMSNGHQDSEMDNDAELIMDWLNEGNKEDRNFKRLVPPFCQDVETILHHPWHSFNSFEQQSPGKLPN